MGSSTEHVKRMNEQYKEITGETLWQYLSQPTKTSERWVFVSGVVGNQGAAEAHMRWALHALKAGRMAHNEIQYVEPSEKTIRDGGGQPYSIED